MKFKIKGKILMIIIFLLLSLSTIIFIYSDYQMNKLAMQEVIDKLDSDLNMGYTLLDERYPGDWIIKGDELYKGNKLIGDGTRDNANNELVDEIKNQTHSIATIFLKNENLKLEQKDGYMEAPYIRISTSVILEDGSRAVGTKISEKVADVIEKGQSYTGEANVAGIICETKYTPIKNEKGEIIGIWFVGVEKETIINSINKVRLNIFLIIAILVVLGIVISILFARNISKRVSIVLSTIKEVENGNLLVSCKNSSSDEIGEISDSLNKMIFNIKNLIEDIVSSGEIVTNTSTAIHDMTDQISSATDEVAITMNEIAKSGSEQAKDTEHGALQVNDLSDLIDNIGELTYEMNIMSDNFDKLTSNGLDTVKQLNDKSKENTLASEKVSEIIIEVDNSTNEIGMITETISDISEQTNLLALNAAIEAARAGEYGKGFSVVAEEIRKLAEQSSDSAKKVKELITKIQSKSKLAVDSINQSKLAANENDLAVKENQNIFEKISETAKTLVKSVSNVKIHNDEMLMKKDEIVGIIENLSAISQQTSAATQEVAASTEEQTASLQEVASHTENLKLLASKLNEKIKQFKIK